MKELTTCYKKTNYLLFVIKELTKLVIKEITTCYKRTNNLL